jgi:hypothetical protein
MSSGLSHTYIHTHTHTHTQCLTCARSLSLSHTRSRTLELDQILDISSLSLSALHSLTQLTYIRGHTHSLSSLLLSNWDVLKRTAYVLCSWCRFSDVLSLSETRLRARAVDVLRSFLTQMKDELRRDSDFLERFSEHLETEAFAEQFGTFFQVGIAFPWAVFCVRS